MNDLPTKTQTPIHHHDLPGVPDGDRTATEEGIQGHWPPKDLKEGGYFTMGKWGMLVNIVAVVWGVGMALNLAWGAFIYLGVILGAGLLWYGLKGRDHIGTLESHAAPSNLDPGRIGV